jgi:hypothetical protein
MDAHWNSRYRIGQRDEHLERGRDSPTAYRDEPNHRDRYHDELVG